MICDKMVEERGGGRDGRCTSSSIYKRIRAIQIEIERQTARARETA